MNYLKILALTGKLVRSKLPQILTALAMGGSVAGVVSSAVETKKSDPDKSVIENYAGTIAVTVVTIGCIAGSAKLYGRRLHYAERMLRNYKRAALAAGLAPTIGEKLALMSEAKRPPEEPSDNRLLIYDSDNDHWFKATEADVLMGRLHLNECAEERGVASVHDFYEQLKEYSGNKDIEEPPDSDIRGWDVATDEWFENHDCHTSIRFSFYGGYYLDDGTEYWVLCSYDPPMYSEYLGAPEEKLKENDYGEDLWNRR